MCPPTTLPTTLPSTPLRPTSGKCYVMQQPKKNSSDLCRNTVPLGTYCPWEYIAFRTLHLRNNDLRNTITITIAIGRPSVAFASVVAFATIAVPCGTWTEYRGMADTRLHLCRFMSSSVNDPQFYRHYTSQHTCCGLCVAAHMFVLENACKALYVDAVVPMILGTVQLVFVALVPFSPLDLWAHLAPMYCYFAGTKHGRIVREGLWFLLWVLSSRSGSSRAPQAPLGYSQLFQAPLPRPSCFRAPPRQLPATPSLLQPPPGSSCGQKAMRAVMSRAT